MKKTYIVLIVIILVIVAGGLFFYQVSKPKILGQITYGFNMWPGNLPYVVAYEQGFFKEEGLDVNFVKEKNYSEKLNNFISKKTDFIGLALIDVVEEVSKGNNFKIILAHDYSNGADGIVAKKEIKNISELKEKKVAVEMGTLGEYLLYDALKKNNLSLSDIKEVNFSSQKSAQAFIRGEVDAVVTYEPDLTQAVEKGNGFRIYTSADSPGLIIDVLIFNDDFVIKNPDKVLAVAKAYSKAMDFISTNPDQAYAVGAKYFEITPNELKEQIQGIKFMTLEDNLNMMQYGNSASSLHGLINQAFSFLQIKGAIKEKVDSTKIIEPKFIRELNK